MRLEHVDDRTGAAVAGVDHDLQRCERARVDVRQQMRDVVRLDIKLLNLATFRDRWSELVALGKRSDVLQACVSTDRARFLAHELHAVVVRRVVSSQPVYRYLYSKLRPPLADNSMTAGLAGGTVKKDPNAPKAPEAVGAPHACEIEYCMGNLHLVKEYAWTEDDFKVSETMQNYFANFIKTGNPNGAKLPEWKVAKAGDPTPPVMIINVESKTENAQNDARYSFLDRAYKNN